MHTKLTESEKEERRQQLNKMQAASDQFYRHAVSIGIHPFIEFTGLMNEYIKLCRDALEKGIDFTASDVHSFSEALPLASFQAEYLGEKFGCIFARTFAERPKELKLFLRAAGLKP